MTVEQHVIPSEIKPVLTPIPLAEQPTFVTLQQFEGLVQRLQEGALPTHKELTTLLAVDAKQETYTKLREGKIQGGFAQHVSDTDPYDRAFSFTGIGFADEIVIPNMNTLTPTRYALHYFKPSHIQEHTTDLSTVHAAGYCETVILFSQKADTHMQAHIGINRRAKTYLINLSIQQPGTPQHLVLLVEPDKTTDINSLNSRRKTRRHFQYFIKNKPHN